ncbi:hypothetical protein CF335_g6131, partial [Tilletia laevis]
PRQSGSNLKPPPSIFANPNHYQLKLAGIMSSVADLPLSEADKKEMQTFLEGESARARVQATIHDLTNMCWTKCKGTSSISSDFNRGEAACLSNCVERFLDTSLHVVNQINQMGQQGGASGH